MLCGLTPDSGEDKIHLDMDIRLCALCSMWRTSTPILFNAELVLFELVMQVIAAVLFSARHVWLDLMQMHVAVSPEVDRL